MAAMCEEYCGTDEVEVKLAHEASQAAMRAMSGHSPEAVRVVNPLVAKGRGTYWPTKARVEIGGADVVQAYDVDGEPVLPPQCAPLLADVPPETAYERVTRRAGTRTRVEGVWPPERQRWRPPQPTGTPVAKLLRLCEELLECEHPDVDTQWYGKRLAEIKAELGGAP